MSDRPVIAPHPRHTHARPGTLSRARAFFATRPWVADSLFWALPVAYLSVAAVVSQVWVDTTSTVPLWAQVSIVLLMTLPLALRRTAPLISSLMIAAACLLCVLTMLGATFGIVAVPLTIYSTTKWGAAVHGRIVLALGLVGALALGLWVYLVLLRDTVGPQPRPVTSEDYFVVAVYVGFCAAIVLCAWLLGGVGHRRMREIEGIRERNRLLEHERASEARLAADAERMRIAREMHDVIAHSLSIVIAQADGGRYAAKSDPDAAAEALGTIAKTGRDALTQTRSLLGVLRSESGEEKEARPLPGLHEVPSLVNDIRAAGLAVRLDSAVGLPGEPGTTGGHGRTDPVESAGLSEGTGLAVYRIVQESLTNVLKHAGARARAHVELGETEGEFVVTVSDTGSGTGAGTLAERNVRDGQVSPSPAASGNGIIGMRERVQLHGGRFEAGPLYGEGGAEAGFRVTARFPLDGGTRSTDPAQHVGEPTAEEGAGRTTTPGTVAGPEVPEATGGAKGGKA